MTFVPFDVIFRTRIHSDTALPQLLIMLNLLGIPLITSHFGWFMS